MTPPARLHGLTILHTESSLGWGGQEHRILEEARVLQGRGHRLLIAADPRGELGRRAAAAGLGVFPLPFGGRHNPAAFLGLRRLVKAERVDILNTHSSLDSWVGTLAWATLRRRPVLLRTRHLSTPVHPNYPTRWLYHRPARILTTSREIARLLQERLGVPPERLLPVPTGVSLTDFAPRPPDPARRAGLGFPPGTFVIGTVAVLRSWKGHLDLLEAVSRLVAAGRPAGLLIVGEGPYRPVIEAKIRELGLAAWVRLVGHQEDVPACLALMDAVVLASYAHEGVPQALLQALAMARPVVATRAGGIPEVIRGGQTGLLVPPRDPQALAQALIRLMEAPEEAQAFGRRGRELVAAHHSLERMADRLEEIYRELGEGE
ncbi:MAG: glycosyltransferase [Syntrophobacterales bacterium]|nr:glycosyltransferase [Syntrophobacterales bacterium]